MNLPSSWKDLPPWLRVVSFFKKDLENGGPLEATTPDKGNLLSSYLYVKDGKRYHIPVLDIDMPVWVNESTTPGHYHLAIDKHLTAEQYEKLLNVLVEVGIVQQGIIDLQWKADGMTAIRVPGQKKTKKSMSSGKPMGSSKSYTMATNGDILNVKKNTSIGDFLEKVEATSSNWVTVNNATINAAALPAQTVKVPTLVEQETIDKWTTETLPAILTYEKLVEIASANDQSIKYVTEGFINMIDALTPKQNVTVNPAAAANKVSEW